MYKGLAQGLTLCVEGSLQTGDLGAPAQQTQELALSAHTRRNLPARGSRVFLGLPKLYLHSDTL